MHGIKSIATSCMHETFGSTSRARCVENEKGILSIHPFASTDRSLTIHQLGETNVDILLFPFVTICHLPVEHKHLLHNAHASLLLNGHIADGFEGQVPPPATSGARRHYPLGFGVVNPVGDGVGAEAGEDHRVDSTNTRAREHGHGEFGYHWHVERHHVSLPNAAGLERVGDAADVELKLAVGNVLHAVGLVALPDDRCLLAAIVGSSAVAIHGIVTDVKLPSREPGDRSVREGSGNCRGEGREPVEFGVSESRPVRCGIANGCRMDGFVVREGGAGASVVYCFGFGHFDVFFCYASSLWIRGGHRE
mmetsp:Transcript_15653/g.33046  ORF Transcript_15653/g.33046 Transcript_15653/m.33046 type:complete len:307 (+) Transcript_15653:1217-2137(+)